MPDPDLTLAILREIRAGAETTENSLADFRAETKARLDALATQISVGFDETKVLVDDAGSQQVLLGRMVTNVKRRHEKALADHEIRIAQLEDERDKAKG